MTLKEHFNGAQDILDIYGLGPCDETPQCECGETSIIITNCESYTHYECTNCPNWWTSDSGDDIW